MRESSTVQARQQSYDSDGMERECETVVLGGVSTTMRQSAGEVWHGTVVDEWMIVACNLSASSVVCTAVSWIAGSLERCHHGNAL